MSNVNIEDYSIDELLEIYGLDTNFTLDNLNSKISDFKDKNNNEDLVNFIDESSDKLKEYINTKKETSINPTFQTTITRFTNIDSQFREVYTLSNSCNHNSTNYNFELNETLTQVVSMYIYSVEIPYSWYTFAEDYGTNKIKINNTVYDISTGNYSPNDLILELNRVLVDISSNLDLKSGRVSFKNNSSEIKTIVFFGSDITNSKTNRNLGWLLGFRSTSLELNIGESKTADAMLDVWGSRYLLLSLDDFNNNQVSKHMVGIARKDHQLGITNYNKDINLVKTGPKTNDFKIETSNRIKNLTNAQIQSFNSIVSDRNTVINDRYLSPLTTNFFAKIPIRNDNDWINSFSKPIIEFSTQFQKNERNFFGPIDINRLSVRLTDDKGTVINLNGNDWSFSLVTKHIYQRNT